MDDKVSPTPQRWRAVRNHRIYQAEVGVQQRSVTLETLSSGHTAHFPVLTPPRAAHPPQWAAYVSSRCCLGGCQWWCPTGGREELRLLPFRVEMPKMVQSPTVWRPSVGRCHSSRMSRRESEQLVYVKVKYRSLWDFFVLLF
ncbi:hypothetical protein Hamer_G016697 [Homarus americanus]|uniref:Uncharacterized protein n=1 Tax=Homarus americanus TaxID=6706 RepID=A0A8J5TUN2_HOMAM|nr:hypothetical protein Hamer_G016697 [Homarus americanus]